jgi:type VI secretion system protein ImpK
MSALFDRGGRGGRRPPRDAGPRRRPRPSYGDDLDEDGQDGGDESDAAPRAAGKRPQAGAGRRPPAGRAPQPGRRSGRSLFGGGDRPAPRGRGGRRVEWEEVEEEDEASYDEDAGSWVDEDEPDEERPRRRQPRGAKPSRSRQTLLDLCTPVFGHAAVLPREAGGVHPGYQQFRDQVLGALQRIIGEAAENGIEREDAIEARYALALFMDEQVSLSEWSGRAQWSGEPLNTVLLNDPQGGVNFYHHLEQMGERQKAVKRIYLLCLALGYRGKYAELDPTQQAAEIGNIRQKTLRSIQEPLDQRDVLFPEAYQEAEPLEGQVPPPPKWWIAASAGATVLLILIWIVMFWYAGSFQPRDAGEALGSLLKEAPAAARPPGPPSGTEGAE